MKYAAIIFVPLVIAGVALSLYRTGVLNYESVENFATTTAVISVEVEPENDHESKNVPVEAIAEETVSEKPVLSPAVQKQADPIVEEQVPKKAEIPEAVFEDKQKEAIVNLYCTNRTNGSVSSGSGVIIDERGVILTNAHVALPFLFSEWPSLQSLFDCFVRTGSPAYPRYRATLIYIPPSWIKTDIEHYYDPKEFDTGGNSDYAILVITKRTNPQESLPEVFQHIEIDSLTSWHIGTTVYLSGYSAGFSGAVTMQRELYRLTTNGKVEYTNSIDGGQDVIGLGGTIASQHGSSGGAVIAGKGKLIGLMTFLNDGFGYRTDERELNAITVSYIDRDMKTDIGKTISEFLSFDLQTLINDFESELAPIFRGMYVKIWNERS